MNPWFVTQGAIGTEGYCGFAAAAGTFSSPDLGVVGWYVVDPCGSGSACRLDRVVPRAAGCGGCRSRMRRRSTVRQAVAGAAQI